MDRGAGRAGGAQRLAEWAPAAGVLALPPGLPPRLRRLPGRALLRGLRAATRLGLRRPPAARGLGRAGSWRRWRGSRTSRCAWWRRWRWPRPCGSPAGSPGPSAAGPSPSPWPRLATGLAPVALSLGSYFSMNAFDLLFWALIAWILVRVLSDGPERLWLAFGAVAGLGLLNKISILYLGFGLVVGPRPRAPVGRLPVAPLLGGRASRPRDLPAAPPLAARERLADPRVHGQRPPPQDGAALGAGLREGGAAADGAHGLALGRGRGVAPARPGLLARARPRLRVPGRGGRPRLRRRQAVLPGGGVLPRRSPPARWRVEAWTSGRARAAPAGPCRAHGRRGARPLAAWPARSCRSTPSCATPPRSARSPAPRSARPSAASRSSTPTCTAGARWPRRWRASSAPCRPRTGRRPASSARTTGRRGRSSTSPATSTCRRRSPATTATGCGAPALHGRGAGRLGDRRERLDELFADVRLGAISRCGDCMPYEDGRSIWVARGLKVAARGLWPRPQGLHLAFSAILRALIGG